MTAEIYPAVTGNLTHMRRELAPDAAVAFSDFGKAVFADGALSAKIKNIAEMEKAGERSSPAHAGNRRAS